jgi:hypothetical protein
MGANSSVLWLVLLVLHAGPKKSWVVSESGKIWVRVVPLLAAFLMLLLNPVHL